MDFVFGIVTSVRRDTSNLSALKDHHVGGKRKKSSENTCLSVRKIYFWWEDNNCLCRKKQFATRTSIFVSVISSFFYLFYRTVIQKDHFFGGQMVCCLACSRSSSPALAPRSPRRRGDRQESLHSSQSSSLCLPRSSLGRKVAPIRQGLAWIRVRLSSDVVSTKALDSEWLIGRKCWRQISF